MEKERKVIPKECVSTSAAADLHKYFLHKSDIKFNFLLTTHTHTHTHQPIITSQDDNLQIIDPDDDDASNAE